MKNFILGLSILLGSEATFGGLTSKMPSTFTDISIPNAHLVSENVIRGMAPRNVNDLQELLDFGVEKFLMFKIDTNGDIAKEIELLKSVGVNEKDMTHLEFPWKDITDYVPVCEMSVDALNMLRDADRKSQKIFFHCTVGEDRTGYLAGLYKIYSQSEESREEIFENEMCDKGYEAGNPFKGFVVVRDVKKNLTPAFMGMADLIEKNMGKKLTKSMCKGFKVPKVNFTKFSCKKSKLIQ